MDFFGIGAGELLLILIVALIIWGPSRLPKIARTLGSVTRQLKKATSDFTTAIAREADLEEKTKTPPDAGKPPEKTEPKPTAEKPAKKPGADEQ
jgi:Tat protein translocase TatB subunit